MFSRREFLTALPLAACAAPALAAPPAGVQLGCQTNAWRIDPNNFDDLLSVLAKLKKLGFDGFETGFRNVQGQFANAAQARAQLERTGLQFFGVHIFLDQYDARTQIAPLDLIRTVADGAATLGAQRVIVSGAGLVKDGKLDQHALQRKAIGLMRAGNYCRTKGMRLAYHNHPPEFAADGLEIETLYRSTNPTLVDFLVDAGWAWRAGANLPKFFAAHHWRIIGLHLRDFKGEAQTPLGGGEFPLAALTAAIRKAKWNGWVLNEEERLSGEKPGESAVAPAREALRKALGK